MIRRGLLFLLVFSFLVMNGETVAASHEETYVSNLQLLLTDAGGHLGRARLALELCLSDNASCAANPEPFLVELRQSRVGIESALALLRQLEIPERYTEIHGLALEGLLNLSVALGLLIQGLDARDQSPIELAVEYTEAGRDRIDAAIGSLALLPPQEHTGVSGLLWPLVVAMAAIIGFNSFLMVRHVWKTSRKARAKASQCPHCGQAMEDWRNYPTKVVQDWMARHIESYHRP